MAAATLQELRDFVRLSIDVDIEEVPDSLVDTWIREGFRRAIRRNKRWPFYEDEFDFTTPAGQTHHFFVNINPTLEIVKWVVGRNGPLQWIEHEVARTSFTLESPGASEPQYYSFWNDCLCLWPEPDGTYSYDVGGYRKPTDWTRLGSGTPADCPDDFTEVIQEWCLFRGYAFLDDPEMAATHRAAFEEGVIELTKQYLSTPEPQPVVLNGGRRSTGLPARLRFPFE